MSGSRRQPYVGNRDFVQSRTDPDMNQLKQSNKYENDAMWREEGVNEVRHRQIRVEKWVKSINNECLKDDSSKPQRAKYQKKPWDGEAECFTNSHKVYNSDRNLKSNQKTSQNYPYSKRQMDYFSGTFENTDFKKQGERKPNNWRKPNIPGRDQFLANLSKVEDNPPEFEISEDMIVKIEGHTVQRDFNYQVDVARSYEQEKWVEALKPLSANEYIQPNIPSYDYYNYCEDEIERYSVQENSADDEPLPGTEYIQQETEYIQQETGYIQQETDYFNYCEIATERYNELQNYAVNEPFPAVLEYYQQDSDTKCDLWEKTGRWEDCNYDYDGDVETQDFVVNAVKDLHLDESKVHKDVKYQVKENVQSTDGNQKENMASEKYEGETQPMSLNYSFSRVKSFSTDMLQAIPADREDYRETFSE